MSKFNIKTNKEPLSSDEISRKMDFDKFYSGYEAASAAGKASWLSKTAKIYLSATAVVVVTATFVIYKSVNGKKETEQTAFINPPIPQLNYQSEGFVIDNSKDTTIVYKSGTTIYVPAGAFKRKDGKEAGKNVRISYREFRDPVDFIFSGIPMDYDSAGVKLPFESAGMFEVLGYENDSIPLYLKDGKTLNVNFLSDNDENKFNVYYLDTVAKRWDFEEHETRKHREDMDKISKEKSDFLAKHNLDDPNKLITPKKASVSLDNFTIDYNKDEFPELAVYEGVKFEVSSNEKNYTPEFKRTTWEDVFISRHPEGKNYILTFKQKNNKVSITAIPVFDEKNFESAMKEYEKMRLSHSKRLLAQADSLKRLDEEASAHLSRSNDKNERFNAYVQAGSVYRSIVVGSMGIWNFDKPINTMARYNNLPGASANTDPNFYGQRNSEEKIKAYFVSAETNEKLLLRGIFFIKRNINAIFPVIATDISQFPVDLKNSNDILIGIGNDFKVYYIKDDLLHSIQKSGNLITFPLKYIDYSESDDSDRTITNRRMRFNIGKSLDRIKTAIDLDA
jgi:hypothetical protein